MYLWGVFKSRVETRNWSDQKIRNWETHIDGISVTYGCNVWVSTYFTPYHVLYMSDNVMSVSGCKNSVPYLIKWNLPHCSHLYLFTNVPNVFFAHENITTCLCFNHLSKTLILVMMLISAEFPELKTKLINHNCSWSPSNDYYHPHNYHSNQLQNVT